MATLHTHDAAHTRDYLAYREFPSDFGTAIESAILPTMEYLVLFESPGGDYLVVAYDIDELLPVVVLEEGIPTALADYALAFHLNLLASPENPTIYELQRLQLD